MDDGNGWIEIMAPTGYTGEVPDEETKALEQQVTPENGEPTAFLPEEIDEIMSRFTVTTDP